MRSGLVGIVFVLLTVDVTASSSGPYVQDTLDMGGLEVMEVEQVQQDSLQQKEPERWVAAGLAVLVGPFGAHRLYFGTKAKVPIIYGVTLGGFGVLVLIDLGHILFTKDLTPYRGNDKVFMWGKPKAAVTPP